MARKQNYRKKTKQNNIDPMNFECESVKKMYKDQVINVKIGKKIGQAL